MIHLSVMFQLPVRQVTKFLITLVSNLRGEWKAGDRYGGTILSGPFGRPVSKVHTNAELWTMLQS